PYGITEEMHRTAIKVPRAHLNNPIGAFGLNGGIHDAFNLVAKLSRVCRGAADASLLDLYVRQRRAVNSGSDEAAWIKRLTYETLRTRTSGSERRPLVPVLAAASAVYGRPARRKGDWRVPGAAGAHHRA